MSKFSTICVTSGTTSIGTAGPGIIALILAPLVVFGQATNGRDTAPERAEATNSPAIVLHLDDHWRLQPPINRGARAEVMRIFTEAGVHASWVDGNSASPGAIDGLMHVTVLILDATGEERMATIERLDRGVAGVANREINRVYIFYSRVSYHARVRNRNIGTSVGMAIVHEVGHLLLGKGHSYIGIMRAELNLESMLPQGFTRIERAIIRSRLSTTVQTPLVAGVTRVPQ
jgi:hypothetical protein